jgi:hypothetical protein
MTRTKLSNTSSSHTIKYSPRTMKTASKSRRPASSLQIQILCENTFVLIIFSSEIPKSSLGIQVRNRDVLLLAHHFEKHYVSRAYLSPIRLYQQGILFKLAGPIHILMGASDPIKPKKWAIRQARESSLRCRVFARTFTFFPS